MNPPLRGTLHPPSPLGVCHFLCSRGGQAEGCGKFSPASKFERLRVLDDSRTVRQPKVFQLSSGRNPQVEVGRVAVGHCRVQAPTGSDSSLAKGWVWQNGELLSIISRIFQKCVVKHLTDTPQ